MMDKKLNILFITQLYPLSEDSSNSFALHYFSKEWAKNHNVQTFRIYLPYEDEKKPLKSKIKIDNITIDIIRPFWIPFFKICIINKNRFLDKINIKPDIIICHLYNSYLTFSFLKNVFKVPFIAGIHRSDVLLAKNLFHRRRIRKALQNVDMISYRSKAIKSNFEKLVFFPKKKTYLALSGLPEYLIKRAKESLHTNNYIWKKPKKVLSVCRLIKLKQIDKVIMALSELHKQGIDWEYTIIGDGPEKKSLEELVNKLGLANCIIFLGKLTREEVFEQMYLNEYFIMPSYNETFGLVYLEAMANSCIVIGSFGWGIDGVIQDNINGFLCDPMQFTDILNVLKKALSLGHKECKSILDNSLKTVIDFSLEKKSKDYLKAINL